MTLLECPGCGGSTFTIEKESHDIICANFRCGRREGGLIKSQKEQLLAITPKPEQPTYIPTATDIKAAKELLRRELVRRAIVPPHPLDFIAEIDKTSIIPDEFLNWKKK